MNKPSVRLDSPISRNSFISSKFFCSETISLRRRLYEANSKPSLSPQLVEINAEMAFLVYLDLPSRKFFGVELRHSGRNHSPNSVLFSWYVILEGFFPSLSNIKKLAEVRKITPSKITIQDGNAFLSLEHIIRYRRFRDYL